MNDLPTTSGRTTALVVVPAPRTDRARATTLVPAPRPGPVPMAGLQGILELPFDTAPAPRPAAAPEVLERFARRFAHALVEVTCGDRSPQQLLRWTSERVYDDLSRRARELQETMPSDRRVRRIRPQVRSVRVFRPAATAAEVCIHVRHGRRSQAIAARIDQVDGHWSCTAVQFG